MGWREDDSLSVTYTGQKKPQPFPPCSSVPHHSFRNLLMSVTIFTSNEVTPAAVLPACSYCVLLTLTANDTCQISPRTPSFVLLVQALQMLACMNTSNHEDNQLTSNSERTISDSGALFYYIFLLLHISLYCIDPLLMTPFNGTSRMINHVICQVGSVLCLLLDFSTLIPWLEIKNLNICRNVEYF